ncbi:MAG: hypothetical protein AB7P76_08705 [Candidatus Melainabacteria bacterium]
MSIQGLFGAGNPFLNNPGVINAMSGLKNLGAQPTIMTSDEALITGQSSLNTALLAAQQAQAFGGSDTFVGSVLGDFAQANAAVGSILADVPAIIQSAQISRALSPLGSVFGGGLGGFGAIGGGLGLGALGGAAPVGLSGLGGGIGGGIGGLSGGGISSVLGGGTGPLSQLTSGIDQLIASDRNRQAIQQLNQQFQLAGLPFQIPTAGLNTPGAFAAGIPSPTLNGAALGGLGGGLGALLGGGLLGGGIGIPQVAQPVGVPLAAPAIGTPVAGGIGLAGGFSADPTTAALQQMGVQVLGTLAALGQSGALA